MENLNDPSIHTEPHPPINDYDDPDRHPVCEDCGTPHELEDPRGKGREWDLVWCPVCSCPDQPYEVGLAYGGGIHYGERWDDASCTVCSIESGAVRHPWAVGLRMDGSDRCDRHRLDFTTLLGGGV